jgi:phage I-like protein
VNPSHSLIALHADAPLADGKRWIHLLPAGTFTGIDGRGPYDATDLEGIALASRDYAGQRQMVLDYDHGTDLARQSGAPAIAAGWIVGLQVRDDGIWGLAELTEKAAAHVAAREYRYLSPVFRHDKAGKVSAILRASLTNSPNLDMLTALGSAEDTTTMDDFVAQLRELLGLPVDADKPAIITALAGKLTAVQSAEPDPAKYVPIGQFQRTLNELNQLRQGVSKQAAEDHVDEQIGKGRLLPWMRDWAVSLCMSNLSAFDDFLAGIGPGFAKLRTITHAGRLPASSHSAIDAQDAEIARNMGFEPEAFAAFRAKSNPAE